MSTLDIAKDVLRIASTAGLTKDVIDLLEKKLALLTDENENLKTKVSILETENFNLKQQIQHSKPTVALKKETADILRTFFNSGSELSVNHFVHVIPGGISVIQYHFDLLLKDHLIDLTTPGVSAFGAYPDQPDLYSISSEGRKYVVENIST